MRNPSGHTILNLFLQERAHHNSLLLELLSVAHALLHGPGAPHQIKFKSLLQNPELNE